MNRGIQIRIYKTETGREPFNIWFNKLDKTTRVIIDARLERVKVGNLGECKLLKDGLWEFILEK